MMTMAGGKAGEVIGMSEVTYTQSGFHHFRGHYVTLTLLVKCLNTHSPFYFQHCTLTLTLKYQIWNYV